MLFHWGASWKRTFSFHGCLVFTKKRTLTQLTCDFLIQQFWPKGISSKMWTPLSLFLYVSICFLTESSMYKLQDSGIKVLKFLPVSDGEECNRTCEFVTDEDGLKCNWVVIEEDQNLCFYLRCLDISVCKEAAVKAVKDLQIGKYSPLKNLHRARRGVRNIANKTVPNADNSSSVNYTSDNKTGSAAVTNSSTKSSEVSNTNTTKITATVSAAGKQFTVTSSSTSPSLPSLTMTTTAAPTTSNSITTIAEVSSITTASTANFSVVSSPHESTTSIINSNKTTPVPTSKHESSVTPTNKLKGTTTSLRSTPITTPKTTQSLTTQLTTVTPMEVSTTKLIPDTEQKQTWTSASTITGGVSQSPKTKSRTTIAFSNGKSYVFPSVPAGALIKYLADTSSLMAILIFGVLFFLVSIILFAHKAFESYKRKDYVQVDYLINGMYADSDM
ncbi:uncharacterized protein C11orf24 homolog isoform X2 [Hypanus sabinus]|nr:uncharacterized protein C11orf24 homolog isoform X2 [Hypanus sabinus]